MADKRKLFKRTDLILIGIMLAVAIAVYFAYGALQSGGELVCSISVNGEPVKTVELSADAVFSLDDMPNVVFEIKNGAIAFIKSDCPDQVCTDSGFLAQNGQMAACLPNMVSIRVTAVGRNISHDDPDMIAY